MAYSNIRYVSRATTSTVGTGRLSASSSNQQMKAQRAFMEQYNRDDASPAAVQLSKYYTALLDWAVKHAHDVHGVSEPWL